MCKLPSIIETTTNNAFLKVHSDRFLSLLFFFPFPIILLHLTHWSPLRTFVFNTIFLPSWWPLTTEHLLFYSHYISILFNLIPPSFMWFSSFPCSFHCSCCNLYWHSLVILTHSLWTSFWGLQQFWPSWTANSWWFNWSSNSHTFMAQYHDHYSLPLRSIYCAQCKKTTSSHLTLQDEF